MENIQGKEFKRLVVKPVPRTTDISTPESNYWKKFQAPTTLSQIGPVTHIDVSPVSPHHLAVTTSTRIHLYSTAANDIIKTFSRFRDVVYSGTFRSDGRLLVAGGEAPIVQVLDINTRSVLRQMKGHAAAIHCTKFTSDNTHVFSCSDDKTARLWDLPTGEGLCLLGEHTDYVRTASASTSSPHVWATGSYDHTVKLWDLRMTGNNSTSSNTTRASTLTLQHDSPVEATLMLPGGGLLLSAGGNNVKVWDLLSGGRLLHTFSNHQKTITTLALDGSSTRLITASLDGHVKFYNLSTYNVLHGFKYPHGVLSVGMSPVNSHLLVGCVDGSLITRKRKVHRGEVLNIAQRDVMIRGGTYQYFLRGRATKGPQSHATFTVTSTRHKRIAPYDRCLRKFEYKKALNEVLDTRSPILVASMLEELRLRMGLDRALRGRDEESLEPLLAFLVKYVTDPKYSKLLIPVCKHVCEIYAPRLGQSLVLDQLFIKLREKVLEEVRLQKQLMGLVGMMETIMAARTVAANNIVLNQDITTTETS